MRRMPAIVLVLGIGATASPALADAGGVASGVLAQLTGLARPAITLGLVWLGILIMMGRGSLQVAVTFLIGLVIVLSGGIW